MPRMNAARPALAAWLLAAAPTLAFAQASAPSGNLQSAPSGTGTANGNPQQEVVGAPEPPGLGITYGGEIDSKVQLDGRFNRTRSGYAKLYAKSVGTAYVNLGDAVSIRAEGTYERFRNQSASTAFNSEGLYLSQLYGTYTLGPVTAYAGKIHPRFSVGYDQVPGIYDTFANDYEQKERVGAGALVNVLPGYGRHILSAEAYYIDNSILSRSLLSNPSPDDPAVFRPGRLRTRFGGAGNTGRPDSFDVALDGSRIPGLESLRYHLGVTRASVNPSDERAETGVTAALSYEFKLTPRIAMTPFVEYAHFDNFGGANGEQRDYVVSAVEFDYRKYALSFVAAPRRVALPGEATRWDLQYSTTLSYTIMPRLVVSAGYLRTRDGGQVENTVGTAINYVLRF
jgi:hypothetical protein